MLQEERIETAATETGGSLELPRLVFRPKTENTAKSGKFLPSSWQVFTSPSSPHLLRMYRTHNED